MHWFKGNDTGSVTKRHYNQFAQQSNALARGNPPPSGGHYVTPNGQGPQDSFARGPGGNSGGRPGGQITQNGLAAPNGEQPLPVDPMAKTREISKRIKKLIAVQNQGYKEVRRAGRRAVDKGDEYAFKRFLDTATKIRMAVRKLEKVETNMQQIGIQLSMAQCQADVGKLIVEMLKSQQAGPVEDMEEATREFFERTVDTDEHINKFLDDMIDFNDPDGESAAEMAKERDKAEAEFRNIAAPEALRMPAVSELDVQKAREKLISN